MKMTKIAFWRKVKENIERGLIVPCTGIFDADCPYDIGSKECCICGTGEGDNALKYAKAYIKRHESKSKKKDHILDTTKKVTRPNFRKYLRDNIDMKVRVTPELSEELQKIMELEEGVSNYWNCTPPKHDFLIIRTAEPSARYSFIFADKGYGLKYAGKEYNPETDTLVEKVEEPKPIKTVGIDNSDVTLTAQHEPVKDCHVNSEYPQPIKLPDFVYSASKNGVGFIDTKNRTFNTNDKGELLLNDKPCFATPEEALQVAKKLWNGEGK